MSVVIETTLGDITVDLFCKERPRACQNFLKLCKTKYYNYNLFHTVSRGFIAQTGDPTGSRNGGESIFGVMEGPLKRFFVAEANPPIKHTIMGLVSFVGNEENMIGSQFFFTLGDELTYLDGKHCVFGQVTEGLDVLELINEAICDTDDRPYQDIRITHTVILDDPLPDLKKMIIPSRSPSPSAERLQGGRIAPDEEIDETAGKSIDEINELIAEREAKARATILEMVGDLPDAEMAPPENVLFVCKLNPVTSDDDLEIIFSRFGKIKSCEVIRDHKTGDSLQYAFVEFENQKSCEDAYFKMDNVLIDDRRIHVDFSQSVSKVKWMGKGRGVKHFDEKENQSNERENNGASRKDRPSRSSVYDNQSRDKRMYGKSSEKKSDKRYHNNGNSSKNYRAEESRRENSNRRSRSRSFNRNKSRDGEGRNIRNEKSRRSSSSSESDYQKNKLKYEKRHERRKQKNSSSSSEDDNRKEKLKSNERKRVEDHRQRHKDPSRSQSRDRKKKQRSTKRKSSSSSSDSEIHKVSRENKARQEYSRGSNDKLEYRKSKDLKSSRKPRRKSKSPEASHSRKKRTRHNSSSSSTSSSSESENTYSRKKDYHKRKLSAKKNSNRRNRSSDSANSSDDKRSRKKNKKSRRSRSSTPRRR